MKKTFNRILVIATGAILLAFAITVRNAKAEWQNMQAYGYDIWCDVGRFCSGPISLRSWEFWRFLGFPPYYDPNWWGNYQEWWDEPYLWNPLEIHYGICQFVPPFSMSFGVPCACVEMQYFAILDEHDRCGYAIPIS